jgi:hypothetical protein
MSTDQAKSVIDRLAGVVWEIEPSKTPMPTIGPDMARGIALADDQTGLQKKSRTKKNAEAEH